jgi:hypothetical protein
MAALLDDPAGFHHQDDVSVADCRKTVGDNETRSMPAKLVGGLRNQQFGAGIHGASRLVEDQQLRAGEK